MAFINLQIDVVNLSEFLWSSGGAAYSGKDWRQGQIKDSGHMEHMSVTFLAPKAFTPLYDYLIFTLTSEKT